MLQSLLLIWVLALDPEGAAGVYERELGYQRGESGWLQADLAAAMERPELAGRPFQTVYPPEGPRVGIRWVQGGSKEFQSMARLGWSAIEFLVRDPDDLAGKLEGKGFNLLHGPEFLTEQRNIRAAQLTGPASELLYVTRIEDPSRSLLPVVMPSVAVGHPFIMVAGSRDLDATIAFFRRHFANPVTDRIPFRIDVLAEAYGQPSETPYDLALVQFAAPFGLEFDQYPAAARNQPLPLAERGGVILVTVAVEAESLPAPLPYVMEFPPHAGQASGGVIQLPSGTPMAVRLR